ncbi:MAG: hypothetical protein AAF492_13280 [Verrucomicrobiota bacterium]
MAVLIMTIGCLVVLLVSNVIIIISNPENTSISTVVRAAVEADGDDKLGAATPFPYGNRLKEPTYVDVFEDRLIIYPGEEIVPLPDLDREGNAFERLINQVADNNSREYIIFLVRPKAAVVVRRLKKTVKERDIDIGYELFEENREVEFEARKDNVSF